MELKPRRKSRRKWIYGGIALVVVLGTGIPLTIQRLRTANPAAAYQLYTVRYGSITQTVSATGTIQAPNEVDLDFQGSTGSAVITAVNVKVGDRVKRGQVLASIDDTSAKIQLQQAQASLASAQARLAQDNQGASEAQIATDKLNVEKAQTALQQAQQAYQNQLQAYNDRTSDMTQLENAQNAVTSAQQNLNITLDNDRRVLADDQNTLQKDQQTLQDVIAQYGNVTKEQVQQAYQDYQNALASYNSWQRNGYAGTNPYANVLQETQNVYTALNSCYNTLQTAQQQYNQGLAAVQSAQTTLANAQSALANAQKALADASPDSGSNAAQQAHLAVQQAQTLLQQAQAQYQAAQSTLKIAQALYDDRTQAKQALDNALSALNQNRVNLQTAQATLSMQVHNGQVVSPISGVVQAVGAQVGQSVGPQTQLITVASTDPAMATVEVPEFDVGKLKKGTKMNVFIPTLNRAVEGQVLAVHPQLDSNTNEYPVDIEIDGSGLTLLPGMQVQARQETQSSETTILVPADAVISLQSGSQEVFVVQNGVAHARIVQVGAMSSSQYQILNGLNPGDQVVVQGQNLLSDGDKVRIVPPGSLGLTAGGSGAAGSGGSSSAPASNSAGGSAGGTSHGGGSGSAGSAANRSGGSGSSNAAAAAKGSSSANQHSGT
ncbi:MAG: efflux RND transporter periplasmic adaptor subunit [Alicyclobacillus sp.]|nr:efflux RND transporter periplasmic adaptor subunit [Alicyclobacillus sp.]